MINEAPGLMSAPTPERYLVMSHCLATIWVKAYYWTTIHSLRNYFLMPHMVKCAEIFDLNDSNNNI